jgi:DNA-binding response OmpR family regulator
MPTALIVEDEPAANRLLAMLVQLRGYKTDSAFTGDEAIQKAEVQKPDLVFLDLMLPDMNGYEVCKTFKCRRSTSGIPIVLVTARLAAENRVEGFLAGAVEYVPKPYTPDQIFEAMSRANSWRSGFDACADTGEIPLDASDEVATLQHASDLRSLLLARTRLGEDEVDRLASSLTNLIQRCVKWGRAHRQDRVATLAFELEAERIAITFRDESGWFRHDDPLSDGIAEILSRGGFRDVDLRDGRDLLLAYELPRR